MDNITNNEFRGYASPFGEGSIFNDEGYVYYVDFKKLIPAIDAYRGAIMPYDYTTYESKATVVPGDPFMNNFFPPRTEQKDEDSSPVDKLLDELESVFIPPGIPVNIYYEKNKKLLFFNGVLNKKNGFIKINKEHIGFVFELNPEKKEIKFRDHIYYTDPATQKRKDQWAIQIESRSFDTYLELCKAEGLHLSESSLNNIQRRYIDALDKAKDKPKTMAWLYNWMPGYIFFKRKKTNMIDDLATILEGSVEEAGAGYINEERIVLNILRLFVAGTVEEKNELLEQLTTRYIKKRTLFEVLYDKMDDAWGEDNWTAAIILLYKIWLVSKFSEDNNYSYSGQPETLAYQSKKILGFYQSGYSFSFSKNQIEVEKDYEEWYGEKRVISKKHFTNYSILQPIQLQEVDENGNFIVQKGEMPIPDKIPAFYLKAFDDKNSWQNFEKTAWIALDVALTFTAVGNLLKLRYLTYLSKGVYYLRVASGVIQLTTSVIDLLLNFADCEGKFCKKLRQYLFWVNIATLGIDAVTERMLRKSAKEVLDDIEELPEGLKKEKDKIKEHLEEVAEVTVKEKRIAEFRDFINKWKGKGIKGLTQTEIADNLKGFTEQANRVSKLIEEKRIMIVILDEKSFIKKYKELGGELSSNELNKLEAFAYGEINYFVETKPIDKFMGEVVHEGTHSIDYLKEKEFLEQGRSFEEIGAMLGDNHSWEKRAFFYERAFQEATGIEKDFETIEEMLNHIIYEYSKH